VLLLDITKHLSLSSGLNLYSVRSIINQKCHGQYLCNRSISDIFSYRYK